METPGADRSRRPRGSEPRCGDGTTREPAWQRETQTASDEIRSPAPVPVAGTTMRSVLRPAATVWPSGATWFPDVACPGSSRRISTALSQKVHAGPGTRLATRCRRDTDLRCGTFERYASGSDRPERLQQAAARTQVPRATAVHWPCIGGTARRKTSPACAPREQ